MSNMIIIICRHTSLCFFSCCYDKLPWQKQLGGKGFTLLTIQVTIPSVWKSRLQELEAVSHTTHPHSREESNKLMNIFLSLARFLYANTVQNSQCGEWCHHSGQVFPPS